MLSQYHSNPLSQSTPKALLGRRYKTSAIKCLVASLTLLSLNAFALTPADISAKTDSVNADRISNAESEPHNWLTHGGTYKEERFSQLKKLTSDNVNQLGLAWSYETDSNRGLEATPLVVDGVMFTTGVWNMVYAHNAATGKLLWKYDPMVPREWGVNACCDAVNRGAAIWEGKLYMGTLDGRLISLDASTGKLLWETLTIDRNFPYTITGAPRVVNGKVLIGNGGAEFGVRGYISAYDANNGDQVWRFYTVPGNPKDGFSSEAEKQAAKTWAGKWWEYGGGGTVWDSMAYDPELNLLYVGVGNGATWNSDIRSPGGGDNLYLSSILALNPDTGEYVWHYQTTPGDKWDYTATQNMILTDLELQGRKHKVLMQAPKNGFFFIIDRENGKLLSAEPFANINWATHYDLETGRPVTTDTSDYLTDGAKFIKPGSIGAHNWQPMSYNPITGLVYIPIIDSGFQYEALDTQTYEQPKMTNFNTGVNNADYPPGERRFGQIMIQNLIRGSLQAWDPVQQKEVWRVDHPLTWNGGTLSTAGNLVFQGTADGRFVAYSADKGDTLWEFDAQTGVMASPVSFEVNGEQYITVMASWGGAFGVGGGLERKKIPRKGRILTFKLNGKDALPPLPERQKYAPPPRMTTSEEKVTHGKVLYHSYCSRCHGTLLSSSGGIPDLRYMHSSRHDLFNQIVIDGILAKAGMVSFAPVLTIEDANDIHAYIIDQAHKDIEYEQSSPWIIELKEWFYNKLSKTLADYL